MNPRLTPTTIPSTPTHRFLMAALCLVVGVASVACSDASEPTSSGAGGAGGNDSGDGGGGNGGGGPSVDLFACAATASCSAVCAHLGPGDCGQPDALACAGDLWLSGAAGVLTHEDRPGPGNFQGDTLVVLRGDGTALRQRRTRSCPDSGSFCDFSEVAWAVGEPEQCQVGSATEDGGCDASAESCEAFPTLDDCVPADPTPSCADLDVSGEG